MTRRRRETLKNYFGAGARPSTQQFADLIDSALIMDDEGFSKTVSEGLRVITLGPGKALMSFETPTSTAPEWSFGFLSDLGEKLALQRGPLTVGGPSLVTFESNDPTSRNMAVDAAVRIARDPGAPRSALDVGGAVRAKGRLGHEVPVAADGKFHPITADLAGCVAFEVMAGVGSPGERRFSLMHAVALNAFNPSPWDNIFGLKNRIRAQHAYYSRRSDRLELRWANRPQEDDPAKKYGDGAVYRLEIRSRTSYKNPNALVPEPKITAFITQLWFDARMHPGAPPAPTDSQFSG